MSDTAKQWVGQVVANKFPLQRYLGGSDRSAVFATERHEGDRVVKAAIKLIPSIPESDALQLERWELGATLTHPHLIAIFEMGYCELGDGALLYVVTECAEENLAEVLSNRALSAAEAREMLEPVLDVLAYLHGRGLVHGHIKPANIMADGDQLKISSDGLCRSGEANGLLHLPSAYDPPESSRGIIPMTDTASPAGDIWSLGATFVEALTQRVPATPPNGQGEVPLPQDLPEPFSDIARHCLTLHPEGRWTVAEIEARLQGRVSASPLARPAATAARPPVRPQRVVARPQRRSHPPARRRGYALPFIVVLALLAIVGGPRLFRRAAATPDLVAPAVGIPAVQGQPEQQAPPPVGQTSAPAASAAQTRQDFEGTSPVPASIRSDDLRAGADAKQDLSSGFGSRPPAAAIVRGEVIGRVMPSVSRSAQDSISGTVRVTVGVDVGTTGSVENAELLSAGPSKYFARLALQAAQRWRFRPPKVAGRNALSRWTLKFDFTSDGTTVVPEQDDL